LICKAAIGILPGAFSGTLCLRGSMGRSMAPQDPVIAGATLNLRNQEFITVTGGKCNVQSNISDRSVWEKN